MMFIAQVHFFSIHRKSRKPPPFSQSHSCWKNQYFATGYPNYYCNIKMHFSAVKTISQIVESWLEIAERNFIEFPFKLLKLYSERRHTRVVYRSNIIFIYFCLNKRQTVMWALPLIIIKIEIVFVQKKKRKENMENCNLYLQGIGEDGFCFRCNPLVLLCKRIHR